MAEIEFAQYCIQGIVDKAFAMLDDPRYAKNDKVAKEIGLYYAMQGNQLQLCKMLLQAGAKTNCVYTEASMGDNLLECAVQVKDIRMVKLLKRSGYNFKRADKDILFCAMQDTSLDIALELVEGGMDISKNENLDTIPLVEAAKLGSYPLVKAIIDRGGKVNAVNRNGNTALLEAVEKNRPDIVELLLKKGADPTLGEFHKPLLTACAAGYPEVLKVLIDGGADINLSVKELTGINLAIVNDHLPIVKVLVEHGALEAFTEDSALNIAARKKDKDIKRNFANGAIPLTARFISKMNGLDGGDELTDEEMDGICDAVQQMMGRPITKEQLKKTLDEMQPEMQKKMDFLRPFLPPETKESVSKRKKELDNELRNPKQKKWCISTLGGLHPMHHAAKAGSIEIMEYLLKHGVDPDITADCEGAETPLYHACLEGEEAAVEYLLKHKVNPNGSKPEMHPLKACLKNAGFKGYQIYMPIIRLLLKYGMQIRTCPHPMLIAPLNIQVPFSMIKHTQMTKLLLLAGAPRKEMFGTWNLPWMTSLIKDCATRGNAEDARMIHLFGFRFMPEEILVNISKDIAIAVKKRVLSYLDDLKILQQCPLSLRRTAANVIRENLYPNAFYAVKDLEIPRSLQQGLLDPKFD